MTMPEHIVAGMKEEYERWEQLLAGLGEQEITRADLPGGWSIKDVIAHLMAWQTRTRARLEAAKEKREPTYPNWPPDIDPDADTPDTTNAWIYQTYRDEPWSRVHQLWREGFQRVLELAAALPEDAFILDAFPWMNGYSMADVVIASYAHHHLEHYEPLIAQLKSTSGQ